MVRQFIAMNVQRRSKTFLEIAREIGIRERESTI